MRKGQEGKWLKQWVGFRDSRGMIPSCWWFGDPLPIMSIQLAVYRLSPQDCQDAKIEKTILPRRERVAKHADRRFDVAF